MNTPITDAAVESDDSLVHNGGIWILPCLARRLESDRAALMEALMQLHSDIFGYGDGSGWIKAKTALAAAKANFPETP